jgi:molecular chaperone DnaJ
VPAGIKDGARLRLKGRGAVGERGGPSGDLYVLVRVAPDAAFTRDGDTLRTEVKVSLSQALLGTVIDVPLPTGKTVVTVPAGTQGGQAFAVSGLGFPSRRSGVRGDLIATVQIRLPKGLDAETRAVVEKLARDGKGF